MLIIYLCLIKEVQYGGNKVQCCYLRSFVKQLLNGIWHLPICIYYIKTKCCLSVGSFFGMHIAPRFLQRSTPDLLDMKRLFLGNTKIF